MTQLLFLLATCIWGSSWIAMTTQIGVVPILVTVCYRIGLAGILYLAALAVLGKLRIPKPSDQGWIAVQALCMFSLNFVCFYAAAAYLPSGLISVVFSLASLFNAVNARIFFGDRITPRTVIASLLGVTGIALLFGRELIAAPGSGALLGLALGCLGTMLFSLGNMVSRRLGRNGVSTPTATSWGMFYGGIVLLALVGVTRTPIVAPPNGLYIAGLVYLAVVASILGFTIYLSLLDSIGPAKAGYVVVLAPIVALTLSTFFEGYHWHWTGLLGAALALLGNVVMFATRKPRAPLPLTT